MHKMSGAKLKVLESNPFFSDLEGGYNWANDHGTYLHEATENLTGRRVFILSLVRNPGEGEADEFTISETVLTALRTHIDPPAFYLYSSDHHKYSYPVHELVRVLLTRWNELGVQTFTSSHSKDKFYAIPHSNYMKAVAIINKGAHTWGR